MQRQMTWKNWPFLLAGILIVAGLLVLSSVFKNSHVISNYLADLGGAISAIILSIATYDEYERRRQRKRYLPPERMGARRIRDEVYQLMFQYAFVVNLRYNPKSPSRQAVDKTAAGKRFTKPGTELHAKAAKHISLEDPKVKSNLFDNSREALNKPALKKLSYGEANELIVQTERTIQQLDTAISAYGYSMTPEVHKWALDVREKLSQAITGKETILSIRLGAASKRPGSKLSKDDQRGLEKILDELVKVGFEAKNVKVE
jgi:hypothetical protein